MNLNTEISKRISESALAKRLLSERFDGIILIECKTQKLISIDDMLSGYFFNILNFDGDCYDRLVDELLNKHILFKSDYALSANELHLKTVCENLEKKPVYIAEVGIKSPNRQAECYKRMAFEYLDSQKDYIVFSCEDISNIIISKYDPLTGLLNFSGLTSRIEKWMKNNPGRKYRVQRYNIDRFHDINGFYGFDVGNRLLKDFAACMRRYNNEDSFSAHLNADHFIRFCADDACTVEQCYNNFNRCFAAYNLSFPIKLHMGVYDLCERDCDSYTMSYKAYLALESVKGNFQKNVAYYKKGMMAVEYEQCELLADIKSAVEQEQFEVWFQPQTDYGAGSLIGAEALIRWRHPKRGLLSPALFIPLLEKSNYISDIDLFVFEKVCQYLKKWEKEYNIKPGTVPISINLSRVSAQQSNIHHKFTAVLKKYDLPPSAVHIEITESTFVDDSKRVLSVVEMLHKAGFAVEMDDFGSGYSSLNFLKDIDADRLKLDMKFLAGEKGNKKSDIIIFSVVNMARALGIDIIAEGVETKEQADTLLRFGCNEMQGYYFSRPLPAKDFEERFFSPTKP